MDTNGDGMVTREEFLGLWTGAFRNQDKDGDGMLTETEFGSPTAFKHADTDQNGKATLTEFKTMYSNQFDGLDRLAREGMRFNHALTPNSVCAPSRAAVLTGKYSHKNGVTHLNQKFDGSQQTFPKLLQKARYETALFGKWHLLTQPTGFDHYCVMKMQGMPMNPTVWEKFP